MVSASRTGGEREMLLEGSEGKIGSTSIRVQKARHLRE